MGKWRLGIFWVGLFVTVSAAGAETLNLVGNPDFSRRAGDGKGPAEYQISGDVEYRYLGDKNRDSSGWGVALESAGRSGSVSADDHGD